MKSIFTNPYSYKQSELKNNLENYLTEIFAGVLKRDYEFLKALLRVVNIDYVQTDQISIVTQSTHLLPVNKNLRPDIEMRIGNHTIILFENKVDSKEREGQLDDYFEILKELEGFNNKHLIYLTKYHEMKEKEYSGIVFTQLLWSDIYDLAKRKGELAKQLSYFIADKNLNMSRVINHLDALVIANLGDVIQKLDSILNTTRDYHKKEATMGIRLDGGRSPSFIKDYGYYITGNWDDKEIQVGFFYSQKEDPQVDVVYRVQGNFVGRDIVKELNSISEMNDWVSTRSDHSIKIEQVSKLRKLSTFMTGKSDEIIDFFKKATDELSEFKEKHIPKY